MENPAKDLQEDTIRCVKLRYVTLLIAFSEIPSGVSFNGPSHGIKIFRLTYIRWLPVGNCHKHFNKHISRLSEVKIFFYYFPCRTAQLTAIVKSNAKNTTLTEQNTVHTLLEV